MSKINASDEAISVEEKKLVQDKTNTNVAFYIHLKEYNDEVRNELEKRLEEVFLYAKGVEWKFDSFGIEKAGARSLDILGYFVFKTTNVEKLQKLFLKEFEDYENAQKISCSVAVYEKVEEMFFEIKV
ncbi:MAG: hypothetical protein HRT40_05260 [Campylobacteraceae bacterium]|nr:hypothetical protein [Campylobacteraceae bacterium]